MKNKSFLLASSACFVVLGGQSVAAQTAPSNVVEEVIVTGSRIVRDGSQMPTPVTVVQSEQIQNLSPNNLADGLRELPQFKGVRGNNNNVLSAQNDVGANLLSLRNLGPERTLVLLDGHRVISGGSEDTTDVNVFPQELVQRVETVTGGASAAYGSDAVAGVVNFVLNRNYTGLKGSIQGGISTYGDGITSKYNLSAGKRFFDGRVHVLLSGEMATKEDIGPYDTGRDWSERGFGVITNNTGVGPRRLTFKDGVSATGATFGGLITSGPLKGTQFGEGGVPRPFIYGDYANTLTHVNGDGIRDRGNLSVSLDRSTLYGRVGVEITPTLYAYTDLIYAKAKSDYFQYRNYFYTANSPSIYASNAFLDDASRQILLNGPITVSESNSCRTLAGQPTATTALAVGDPLRCGKIARVNPEMPVGALQSKELYRLFGAVEGKLPNDWDFEAFLSFGDTSADRSYRNPLHFPKLVSALDAIRDTTGTLKCAVLVPDAMRPANYVGPAYDAATAARFAGCTPFNPFGEGSPSAGAVAYVNEDEHMYISREQINTGFTVNGQLPEWTQFGYERPSFATGIEYRREKVNLTVSQNTQEVIDFTGLRGGLPARQGLTGPFLLGNFSPHEGSADGGNTYSTKEFFAEVNLPVFKEAPFANLLDFNAAYRLTNYSVSGNVNTWKVGAVYEPMYGVRFRATRSRDIRGPSSDELFGGNRTGSGNVLNPLLTPPANTPFISKTGGNPELRPEIADTYTIGVVLTPEFLPRFRFAADYYNINIKDAIGSLSTAAILDLCAEGNQLFCDQVTEQAGLYLINGSQINLSSQYIEGWDFEVGYRTDFMDGMLDLRLFANYQPTNEIAVPGSAVVNNAGQAGDYSGNQNNKLTATAIIDYTHGPFGITYQQQYVSPGKLNNEWVEGVDIDENDVEAYWLGNLSARMKFGEDQQYEAYVSINNVWNRDPIFAPRNSALRQIYTSPYVDTIGRYYTVGLRFKL